MSRGRRGDILASIHPKMMPQVMAQLAAQRSPRALGAGLPVEVEAPESRIRQKAGEALNKTERLFLEWLKQKYPEDQFVVGSQRLRFRLANGAWYKPDNDLWDRETNRLTLFEVKGYMRPKDALTLKVVASLYPWLTFKIVSRKGSTWEISEVLP